MSLFKLSYVFFHILIEIKLCQNNPYNHIKHHVVLSMVLYLINLPKKKQYYHYTSSAISSLVSAVLSVYMSILLADKWNSFSSE